MHAQSENVSYRKHTHTHKNRRRVLKSRKPEEITLEKSFILCTCLTGIKRFICELFDTNIQTWLLSVFRWGILNLCRQTDRRMDEQTDSAPAHTYIITRPPPWIYTLISSTRRTICRVISLYQQAVTQRRRTFGLIKLLNHEKTKKQKQHQRGTEALLQSSSLFPKYRILTTSSPQPLFGIISEMCAFDSVCVCACAHVHAVIGSVPPTAI